MVWRKVGVSLQQKTKKCCDMRNTDYNLDVLGNMISSDMGLQALKDIIEDLGLEMEDALAL
jgi:hypothetical protein